MEFRLEAKEKLKSSALPMWAKHQAALTCIRACINTYADTCVGVETDAQKMQ